MNKLKIALISTAAVAVPAAAIAVPLSMTAESTDEITLTVPQGQTLSILGETVTINANVKSRKPVAWKHDAAPGSIVFKAFDDCVQITCSKNIEDSYSFNIWGSVGNTTSNAIRIFLVPQSTNVELTFNGTDVLQDQGSTVTIVTSYTNKQGATTWDYGTLPAGVRLQSQTDNEIQFYATQDVATSGTFFVTATNNKFRSNRLTVSLILPITSVALSYQNNETNPIHTLSFAGSYVAIKAEVKHSSLPTQWAYALPTGLTTDDITVDQRGDLIIFTIEHDNLTVDATSFGVTATNNNQSATLNVYVQLVDRSDRIVVTSDAIPSGIVYQNKTNFPNAPHIKCPIWKPGHITYTPNFTDSEGDPIDSDRITDISWNTIDSRNPTSFQYDQNSNGQLEVSWAEGAYMEYDNACVLRFTISAKIDGDSILDGEELENDIIINIDFGTITGVKWDDEKKPPVNLYGDSGTVDFAAKVYGQGQLDHTYYDIIWADIQYDDGTGPSPTPPSGLSVTQTPSGDNNDNNRLAWTYTGTADLQTSITVKAVSQDDTLYVAQKINMTLKQTTGVVISGPSFIATNLGKAGSADYTATYAGTSTTQETTWSVACDTAPPSTFTITPSGSLHEHAKLSWDPGKLNAANYIAKITATSTANPAISFEYDVTVHNRGVVTGVTVIGGNSITSTATATVNGVNVDQGVNWSIEVNYTLSKGCQMSVWLKNQTLTTTQFDGTAVGMGNMIANWIVTATSIQDSTKNGGATGSWDASNW